MSNLPGDRLSMPKRTRKVFTSSEDQRLISLVEKYGDNDWRLISDNMPNRTPHQCRERYKYYLSPHVVNGPWTLQEDMLLFEKYREFGPKWSLIQPFFSSRSDINIKNRWTSLKRKTQKAMQNAEPQEPIAQTAPTINETETSKDTGANRQEKDLTSVKSKEQGPHPSNDLWTDFFSDLFTTTY